jgi:hypothetical protein
VRDSREVREVAARDRFGSAERPYSSNNYNSQMPTSPGPVGHGSTNAELYKQLDVLRQENFEIK